MKITQAVSEEENEPELSVSEPQAVQPWPEQGGFTLTRKGLSPPLGIKPGLLAS